jgi:hypothetical protein
MNPLVIKAPSVGIAASPHVGFGDCRNLDIFTLPGVVRLNNLLAKESASVVTNTTLWIVKDPVTAGQVFALDAGGQVYKSTDSGDTWTTVAGETAGGSGQGMMIWKDYLFVARAAALDVYGPLSGSPSWSNSWQTITSDSLWHPMLVSFNDNKLYGGAGKFVFSLDEASGSTFAPGTASTYTWTAQALDLPPNYRIKSLEELGNNLMCGTWMGSAIDDFEVADIFPWDRSSSSFGSPIKLKENGANALLTVNNLLYIFAGIGGKIYISNGADATLAAQIPSYIADTEGGKYIQFYPGAVCHYKGRVFFGLQGDGTNSIDGMGVWSLIRTANGNILTLEHLISTGSDGSSSVVFVGAVASIARDQLIVGWKDGSSYGIDRTTNTLRVTSYGGYFVSPFYNVGSAETKRDFNQGVFSLVAPLATGQGIRIKYRTDISASFTTLNTFDFATLGAVQSYFFQLNLKGLDFIQFRIELTTGATNTTPQFRSLVLR